MAYIDLTFGITNSSIDIGDTVYYVNPTTSGGFTVSNDKVLIGDVESVSTTDTTIVVKVDCDVDLDSTLITSNSFIFFSKNNVVNASSIKGYYGLVEFKNDSTSAMELFSVGCDISQSSK